MKNGFVKVMCCSLLWATESFSASVNQFNHPGGVVEVNIERLSSELPEIRYGLDEPVILEHPDSWRILIGIDRATLPGEYIVFIKRKLQDARAFHETFQIQQKTLTPIIQQWPDDLPAKINHEQLSDLDFTNTEQPGIPLQLPAQGDWKNTFGQNLMLAGQQRSTEVNFTMLTAVQNQLILAPHNAIVSKISPFSLNPSKPNNNQPEATPLYTMVLDHGRGLRSIISGISDLTLKTGNGVVKGAVIGKVGKNKTLFWQSMMNNAYVNPLILTQLKP